MLSGDDAAAIYRRAHRARVAFIAFAKSHVLLHPSKEEAIRKNAISRAQYFFRYKCFVELIAQHVECTEDWVKEFSERFAAACLTPGCDNELDPRCLPLHVFTNDNSLDLFLAQDRAAFDKRYGGGMHRQDLSERHWRLDPSAFHGYEALCIAGTPIPKGFHWDVQPGGRKTLVTTTTDVWLVSRYVNIYPDGHVRGDRPHARRLA